MARIASIIFSLTLMLLTAFTPVSFIFEDVESLSLPDFVNWPLIDKRSVDVGNFRLDITYYEYGHKSSFQSVIFYESSYKPDSALYKHRSLYWYDSQRKNGPYWRLFIEEKNKWIRVEEFSWSIELMPSTADKPSLVLVFSYKPFSVRRE